MTLCASWVGGKNMFNTTMYNVMLGCQPTKLNCLLGSCFEIY